MELQVYDVALVPVIMAVVELAKRFGLPRQVAPLVAVIVGLVFGFIYVAPGETGKAIFLGLVMGLSAVGLFSGSKNTVQMLR